MIWRLGRRLSCLALAAWCASLQAQLTEAPPPAPRFDIKRFVVEGNSLLPQAEVERLVSPHAGSQKDFGDIQRALEALDEAYTARGYTAVRVVIPEQDIRAGEVRLQVIEAKLGAIRVEGNKFFDAGNVRASLPALEPGRSPNTRVLTENIQQVNENPAKQVAVSLASGKTDAEVDAVVKVTDDNPSRFTVFLDNSGSSSTGHYRAGVGYQNANLFNRDHTLSLQYITSPTQASDVTIAGAGYRIPVYSWRGTVDAFLGYSDVNAGTLTTVFGPYSISGSGTVAGLRYTQILPRLDTYDQRMSVGWDYRNFKPQAVFLGVNTTPEIIVNPLSIGYSGRFATVGQDVSFSATYSRNIPGGVDGDQTLFSRVRAGARASYTIWRFAAAVTQTLPQDFLLRASANGQYTRDGLIPQEQFGMGGVDSVRGFLEREAPNDIGHRFSLEAYTPDFGARLGGDWRARALAFVDMARGHDRLPTRVSATDPNVQGLSSAGLGIRMNAGKYLALRLDWARVINASGIPGGRAEGKDRVTFAIAYSF